MAVLIKFIVLPLYPLGLVILLGLAGIVLLLFKKTRIATILFSIGVITLIVFSSPVVAQFLGKSLEFKYSQNLPSPGICSAIVVLGGGGMPLTAPRINPEVNEAGDRILHAGRLFKLGLAPKVITTGGDVATVLHRAPSEALENGLILKEIGVDSSAIVMEHKARNTHEHPAYIAAILDSMHQKRTILLVTSATHMARSVAVFEKFGGYSIYTAPTDYNTNEHIYNKITDFFPTSSALERSTVVLHELYGIIGYKLLGWI